MANQIVDKTLAFAQKAVNVYLHLRKNGHFRLSDQFIGATTSIGANVEEAQAAHSKLDFIAKMTIASKEARESKYWITILDREDLVGKDQDFEFLKSEINEIIAILNSIVKSSRENLSK
ncbi:four helix bundle protein [Algoriphagus sp. CAU 1675]|uniref:four helix bundle protein n=1 Tax=Algoriphagus sp. CAU 1675 TaxID=3032597 RepID=UPI0023DABBCF|nr:four helix bundle protein [Algoriphagus sp. CAU 1675]MDF2159418.1 four helix bundle protein [Algoriphagus sp. CAU 1675]